MGSCVKEKELHQRARDLSAKGKEGAKGRKEARRSKFFGKGR